MDSVLIQESVHGAACGVLLSRRSDRGLLMPLALLKVPPGRVSRSVHDSIVIEKAWSLAAGSGGFADDQAVVVIAVALLEVPPGRVPRSVCSAVLI